MPRGRPDRYPEPMTEVAVEKDVVTWDDLAGLVAHLADQTRGDYDVMLAITRGGLVPAGMLAYRLGIRNILGAARAPADLPPVPG